MSDVWPGWSVEGARVAQDDAMERRMVQHTVIYQDGERVRANVLFATVPKGWALRLPLQLGRGKLTTLITFENDLAAVWFARSLVAPVGRDFLPDLFSDVGILRERLDPKSDYSLLPEKQKDVWRHRYMVAPMGASQRQQFCNEREVRRIGGKLSCTVPDMGDPVPPARDDLVSLLLSPTDAYNIAVPLIAMSHLTMLQIRMLAPPPSDDDNRNYSWREAEAREATAPLGSRRGSDGRRKIYWPIACTLG